MARRVAPSFPRALLVVDAQPLSLLADQDRRMALILKVAEVRRTGQAANHLQPAPLPTHRHPRN